MTTRHAELATRSAELNKAIRAARRSGDTDRVAELFETKSDVDRRLLATLAQSPQPIFASADHGAYFAE